MGPYSDPVLSIARVIGVVSQTRDASREDHLRAGRSGAKLNVPFFEPAERPDPVRRARRERDRVYIVDGWPRGANPRVPACMIPELRRAHRHRLHRDADDPLPARSARSSRRKMAILLEQARHAAYSRISAVSAVTRDRLRSTAHAGQSRRQHGLARHGHGQLTYLPVRSCGGRVFIGERMRARATARCARRG